MVFLVIKIMICSLLRFTVLSSNLIIIALYITQKIGYTNRTKPTDISNKYARNNGRQFNAHHLVNVCPLSTSAVGYTPSPHRYLYLQCI